MLQVDRNRTNLESCSLGLTAANAVMRSLEKWRVLNRSSKIMCVVLKVLGHQSVFMNEPRLSDFKQVLLREGIQAEFVGGVLVCNNLVAVRRVGVLCFNLFGK